MAFFGCDMNTFSGLKPAEVEGGTASEPSHFFCVLSGPNNKSDGTEAVPPMNGETNDKENNFK
jgi:hypothetical protein